MVLSFFLQIVAVTIGVVVSILTVDKLGAFSLPQPMPPAPRAPRPIQVIAVKPFAAASPASGLRVPARRAFVAPSRIPTGLPTLADAPEMQVTQAFGGGDPDAPFAGVSSPGNPVPAPSHFVSAATPPPPPAKTPVVRQSITVGGDVLQAKIVKQVMPVYPALAKQVRISGTVRLQGVISREGRVINLQVVSGHPMLSPAALEAVRQWVYRPTLLNGVPVEVIAPIDVHFTLSNQ